MTSSGACWRRPDLVEYHRIDGTAHAEAGNIDVLRAFLTRTIDVP
ncbi:hypothetical protein [Micromonospora humi]|nr:hypothetical protein [Micromonospora humi]